MPEFPENEIEILREYLTKDLTKIKTKVSEYITKKTNFRDMDRFTDYNIPLSTTERTNLRRALAINEARMQLRDFLRSMENSPSLQWLQKVHESIRKHDFRIALDTLAAPPPSEGNQPNITSQTFNDVLVSNNILFPSIRFVTIDEPPQDRPPGAPTSWPRKMNLTLLGYSATHPSKKQLAQILELHEFVTDGAEHRFRLTLLRAECYLGLQNIESFIKAIHEYVKLLPNAQAGPIDILGIRLNLFEKYVIPNNIEQQLFESKITPRQKFVAIRSGFAHLRLGDFLFRKSRNLNSSSREQLLKVYRAGMKLVQSSGISPDNPLRQQVERYAQMQIAKVESQLNFLGYRDSYVPIIKPEVLQALATDRIQQAEEAIARFELLKSRADQIQDQIREMDFESDIQDVTKQIAEKRLQNAKEQEDIAQKRVREIQSQLDSLDVSSLTNLGGLVLQGSAAGFLAGTPDDGGIGIGTGTNLLGVAGAIGGIASTFTEYAARKESLKAQKEIAKTEARIAGRDREIADLEKASIEITLEFLSEKVKRITNRELNPDLYYRAAEDFRDLAERHLDNAIYFAYLFERAVAFLRMEPELQKVRFDYQSANMLSAASRLAADLAAVVSKNLPITKFGFLTEKYSLRLFFPIEFSSFLQSGDMDFTFSLYELNKRRPGVYRQRIKHVGVKLEGLIPVTGYTGRIIHHGSFLLRDKDTTPEPEAGRFIPTEEQLTTAFDDLKNGATQGVPIGGVIPFLLDGDTIELSPNQPPPDLGDASPEALNEMEGYGAAGDWRLEIENIDLRLITDVVLEITYVIPESDGDLARRVKGLIGAYEQELSQEDNLDLITPFSLRQQFPDSFFQLANGSLNFSLRREDFPLGITDLKLKTIIALAVDQNQNGLEGVSFAITKTNTAYTLMRTTRADGFSEDITTSIPFVPSTERFPVEGTYTLQLSDPSTVNLIDDLILFFVYEFREN